jgi:hypothetical protein
MSAQTQAPARPRRERVHTPDRITWDIARTNWLHEVPLAFGTIESSTKDEGTPDHNLCVRLDGSNCSCGCLAGADCGLERDSEAVARAFWAAWARGQDGDTLIREGRELAYATTFWGTEAWQRMKMDAVADEIGYRMDFTNAA